MPLENWANADHPPSPARKSKATESLLKSVVILVSFSERFPVLPIRPAIREAAGGHPFLILVRRIHVNWATWPLFRHVRPSSHGSAPGRVVVQARRSKQGTVAYRKGDVSIDDLKALSIADDLLGLLSCHHGPVLFARRMWRVCPAKRNPRFAFRAGRIMIARGVGRVPIKP